MGNAWRLRARCPICGRLRSAGGHEQCSRQLQAAQGKDQEKIAAQRRASKQAHVQAIYRAGRVPGEPT